MSRLWKVPRMWPGANVIIIGGGPSFKKIDRSILKDLSLRGLIRVIGVNKAYKEISDSAEWMHVLWFGDNPFYKIFSRIKAGGIYTFPGLRVSCASGCANDKGVKYIGRDKEKRGRFGISKKPNMVAWNKNSGGSAINLAYHFTGPGGKVFLFGFDMKRGKNDRVHWHEGYHELGKKKGDLTRAGKPVKVPFDRWLVTFPTIADHARKLNLKIFNVGCPDSRIEDFPKITFNEFCEMVEVNE